MQRFISRSLLAGLTLPASLMLIAGLMLLSSAASAVDLKPPADRVSVANFSLKNLKGKKVSLADFAGKVVVVNFWATWCEPCKQELPFLNRYYLDNKDDVVVLAIATDNAQTMTKVRSTVKRKRWKMPILLDADGQVSGDLNPRGAAPYTMYLDRNLKLAGDHDGYAPGDETAMLATIKALMTEKATANGAVKAPEVKASEVKASEVKASEVKAPEVKAPAP
ncbi:MAG: thiol-disulfide isomerase/thioredoxin [Bradymonadia bacterium]|jgi:thiol-disulfide isomerase/thioredoxin